MKILRHCICIKTLTCTYPLRIQNHAIYDTSCMTLVCLTLMAWRYVITIWLDAYGYSCYGLTLWHDVRYGLTLMSWGYGVCASCMTLMAWRYGMMLWLDAYGLMLMAWGYGVCANCMTLMAWRYGVTLCHNNMAWLYGLTLMAIHAMA